MALPASDTFLQSTGAAQALAGAYSASWTHVVGAYTVPSGTGDVRTNSGGVDCLARWNADAPNADQYAQVTTATGWAASGRYIGPAVAVSAAGQNGYSIEATASEWLIGRVLAGAWTTIASGSWSAANGDVIRLERTIPNGTTVRLVLKRNGTTVTTFDDTSGSRITAAGYVGLGGYDGASFDPGVALWEGGNLAGAADLAGGATGAGSAAGALTHGVPLAGGAAGGGSATGDLTAGSGLVGGATGGGSASGALTHEVPLAGGAIGAGTAAADLTVKQNVLGSDIPSTGTHGPSVLYNDVALPAEANDWFRAELVTPPSAGTFTLYYDGSFELLDAPNGIYTFVYEGFKNNISYGQATATINIGVSELAGAAAGAGAAGGALSIVKVLGGAAVGSTSVAGALSLSKPLAGGAVSASLAGGALSISIGLQGAALAAGLAAGALFKATALAAAAAGGASATGDLTTGGEQVLQGAAVGLGSAAGALLLSINLGAAAVGAAQTAGPLTHGVPLQGAATGLGSASGGLFGTAALTGAADGGGSGSGALQLLVPLSGAAIAQVNATGALQLDVRMAAAAIGSALAGASLTVTSIVQLDAAVFGRGQAAGNLSVGDGERVRQVNWGAMRAPAVQWGTMT